MLRFTAEEGLFDEVGCVSVYLSEALIETGRSDGCMTCWLGDSWRC